MIERSMSSSGTLTGVGSVCFSGGLGGVLSGSFWSVALGWGTVGVRGCGGVCLISGPGVGSVFKYWV